MKKIVKKNVPIVILIEELNNIGISNIDVTIRVSWKKILEEKQYQRKIKILTTVLKNLKFGLEKLILDIKVKEKRIDNINNKIIIPCVLVSSDVTDSVCEMIKEKYNKIINKKKLNTQNIEELQFYLENFYDEEI